MKNQITSAANQYLSGIQATSEQSALALKMMASQSNNISNVSKAISGAIPTLSIQTQLADTLYKAMDIPNIQLVNTALIKSALPNIYTNLSKMDFRLTTELKSSLNTFAMLSSSSVDTVNNIYHDIQQSYSDVSVESKHENQDTNQGQDVIDTAQIMNEFEMIKNRLEKIEANTENNNLNNAVSEKQCDKSDNKNTSFVNPLIITLVTILGVLTQMDDCYNLVKDLIEAFKTIVNMMN